MVQAVDYHRKYLCFFEKLELNLYWTWNIIYKEILETTYLHEWVSEIDMMGSCWLITAYILYNKI